MTTETYIPSFDTRSVQVPQNPLTQLMWALRMFWAVRRLQGELKQLAEAEDHILKDLNIHRGDAFQAAQASLPDLLRTLATRQDLLGGRTR